MLKKTIEDYKEKAQEWKVMRLLHRKIPWPCTS